MRSPPRSLASVLAASLLMFAAAVAWAETCTLELKRLGPESRSGDDYTYRATYPQSFYEQLVQGSRQAGNQQQAEAFKRIVKKEPKYQSERPFRGVAKLGSQEYAFVLDTAAPPAKEAKPDAEKDKAEKDKKDKKDGEKSKSDSATAKLARKLMKAADNKKSAAIGYSRLYFDVNHNGDLTDDKVIEADAQDARQNYSSGQMSRTFFRFPRVDLTVDNDGTKSDYSFFMSGQSMVQPQFSYLSVSLNAAAYREGDVTLDGKKHRVVLIDFNSNGRFGDEMRLVDAQTMQGGKIVSRKYPQQGDMLLVDPTPGHDAPYDVTESDCRNYVSKMVAVDGRFYNVKMSPSGDSLTLDASPAGLGKMSNPNGPFQAIIYGDAGFLKIRGDKDNSPSVPEGHWKLLSYTIRHAEAEKPKKSGDEKKAASPVARTTSAVTAEVSGDYKAVKVVKGETASLPFGPPYKPTVSTEYFEDGNAHKVLALSLSLVGSAGETCSDMRVNGGRPSKPEFTITDSKGKVIETGSFEYG
jgi:hypothetical protein